MSQLERLTRLDHRSIVVGVVFALLDGLRKIASGRRRGVHQSAALLVSAAVTAVLVLMLGGWGLLGFAPVMAASVVGVVMPEHGSAARVRRATDWESRSAAVGTRPSLDNVTASIIVRSARRRDEDRRIRDRSRP